MATDVKDAQVLGEFELVCLADCVAAAASEAVGDEDGVVTTEGSSVRDCWAVADTDAIELALCAREPSLDVVIPDDSDRRGELDAPMVANVDAVAEAKGPEAVPRPVVEIDRGAVTEDEGVGAFGDGLAERELDAQSDCAPVGVEVGDGDGRAGVADVDPLEQEVWLCIALAAEDNEWGADIVDVPVGGALECVMATDREWSIESDDTPLRD